MVVTGEKHGKQRKRRERQATAELDGDHERDHLALQLSAVPDLSKP
jgi:hypothetical protein